jgi:hypothetical protein
METEIKKYFKTFKYHGIYVYAFLNEENQVKKSCYQPKKEKYQETKHYFRKVFNFHTGEMIEPNGIQIDTNEISSIDIDQPKDCDILDQLLNDCKFYVKTKKGYHFYFNKENELPRIQQCGVADINMDKLWYVPEYYQVDIDYEKNEDGKFKYIKKGNNKYKITTKYDEHEEHYGSYKLIKNEGLVDMPKYAIDWCKMLVKFTPKKDKETKNNIIKNVEKLIINPNYHTNIFDTKTINIILKIFYDHHYFDKNEFQKWVSVAYMTRHLNNSEEAFKLFDKYSRKVEEYKNNSEYNNRKFFYGNNEYNENFEPNGVLIKCSKLDPDMYKKDLQLLYKSNYDKQLNKFNHQYIYNDKTKYIFDDWNEEYKCLCIRSAYGTGKTHTFKKLIDINKYERVLFITYRQSLAHSLGEELTEKYKFVNYLDGDIKTAKRVIIQLDSIKKLLDNVNIFTQKDGIPKYDLVVLDESEGLLNHLSFEKIDQYLIHNVLSRILTKCNKILVLDGDMSDRTYDCITTLGFSYKLYVNEYKPNKKHFIFGYDIEVFDNKIDYDLKAKKKIVLVCMTRTESEKYNDKYKGDYKVIIHNSIEKNKDTLKKVNEKWAECDILIYSPTVESGVDFNIVNYFDKCYSTISNMSTSYRAFFQMLNRVRYYKEDCINVLIPYNIIWKPLAILVKFDEMRIHKWQNVEITNLTNILIHNDVEKFNSKKYLIASIIMTLKSKGHTFEYLGDKPQKRPKTESHSEIIRMNIINAEDITDTKFNELMDKQIQNMELSRAESNSVIKYFYKKAFLLENLDESNLKDHYNKFSSLFNFKVINNDNRKEYLINNSEYKYNIEDHKEKLYLIDMKVKKAVIIDNLLKIFNCKINNNKITQIDETKETVYYNDIKDEILKVINNKDFKFIFECDQEIKNNNIPKITDDILDGYGLKLQKTYKKTQKEDTDGKKIKGQDTNYKMDIGFNPIINGYLERKAEIEKINKEKAKIEFENDPLNYGLQFIDDIIENEEFENSEY